MATKTKQWSTGTGSATIQYSGQGNGTIVVTSDDNNLYEARSMQVKVKTTDGSNIERTITINQAARQRIDLSAAVVTAATQTYSGSAKTPTPTVTLNGSTVPSSGYDVSYSNNTNAGTANITITGKGDYTGTAYGTFTINKATPSYTAPTYRSLTYSGSAQYLTTTGSTSDGTIQYSSDGINWYSTRRQGTDAGDYTTYWRLVGDSNHTDINATSISTTIAKATPSYTAPSLRTGLTYSGSSQYLTTSGSTSDGTIYYSTDGSNWYASRRSATTAGTYYCYWKLTGDSNHSNIGSTYLGTTTIAKASRTLSFTDSYVVLNTSSNITKTATVNKGSGDGAITYSISSTTYATINSSTGKVTSKTSDGSATVTATIAEGTNYLSASASYTLYVFATTHNYSYNGSYRSVTLPPGTYQFQVWGAQGGSNAADSQYGITSKAGGKGGYSVGQLTVSQTTAVRVYVGGQGGSSSAGYNGGGSSWGASIKDADNELGVTKCAGGGGASDIRLSDGSLYSRMIVAGGGSGGAMCYQKKTTQVEKDVVLATYGYTAPDCSAGLAESGTTWVTFPSWADGFLDVTAYQGKVVYLTHNRMVLFLADMPTAGDTITYLWRRNAPSNLAVTIPSNCKYIAFAGLAYVISTQETDLSTIKAEIHGTQTETEVTENWDYQVGYAGGGTNGLGYSSTYYGKQNAAGNQGGFGVGAAQQAASWRYVSGAGGGGWYGGGRDISNYSLEGVKMSGGGSGFVNTAASAGNRPSGYTGLQLDSGTTYAGNTSFPSTSGGTETGHSGNGYVRITRL